MKKSFVEKNYFNLQGKVTEISDLIHIERNNLPDLFKKMINVVTIDNQRVFAEIRNKNLSQLEDIKENDIVDIQFAFQGSVKDGKNYNNIYIHTIKKVK